MVVGMCRSCNITLGHLSTLPSPWTTKPKYFTPAAHAHTGNEAKLGKWEGGIPAPYTLRGGEMQCAGN